jgi:hypothetical protein
VTTLEAEGNRGNLDGAVVVMCTDYSSTESAANRASSTSPNFYRLAVRLRALQFRHGAQFIVSDVAGERMKDQGTDGVSQGHLKEGIAVRGSMIKFIPFHKSALTSSPTLRAWLKSWAPTGAEFLEPEEWFKRGHDQDILDPHHQIRNLRLDPTSSSRPHSSRTASGRKNQATKQPSYSLHPVVAFSLMVKDAVEGSRHRVRSSEGGIFWAREVF